MRQAQKLLEDQDSISDGFLILLAMAGGTGSGVGSKITESIRDEFGPKTPLIAHATWPYENGEVVVQSYNTLLTLATLLNNSDGIIFHIQGGNNSFHILLSNSAMRISPSIR